MKLSSINRLAKAGPDWLLGRSSQFQLDLSASMDDNPSGFDEKYFSIWERVNARNALSSRYGRYRVCTYTGTQSSEHASVIPLADTYTTSLDLWMSATQHLPSDQDSLKLWKRQATNNCPLSEVFTRQMRPNSAGFLFFPTRLTLVELIRHAEAALHRTELSQGSFLGFRSNDLIAQWPLILDGIDAVKIYEYEGWPLNNEIGHMVRCSLEDDGRMDYKYLKPIRTEEVPLRYEPVLPTVHLALSPFNVVLSSWRALRRVAPNIALSTEARERVFSLGEYFLELAEVDTPSAYRNLRRPSCLDFTLPPFVQDANTTHRFHKPDGDKESSEANANTTPDYSFPDDDCGEICKRPVSLVNLLDEDDQPNLENPYETWEEWRDHIHIKLQDTRDIIRGEAFPNGQVTSAILKALRYSRNPAIEYFMVMAYALLECIEVLVRMPYYYDMLHR